MKNTRNRVKIASTLTGIVALAAAIFSPSEVMAAAGGIQNCTVGSTCTVGEFLYDDSSVALTGATCTLTSKYPDGTSYLSSQAMTGQSDGWYAYEFTAPSTTGLYRATVSCTSGGDIVSIDRSFQVSAASSSDPSTIAAAVWSYSGRTVSSFGTLIADIWSNATRTLTGADLTSGKLASQSDVTAVGDKVDDIEVASTNITNVTNNVNEVKTLAQETRLLLEKVVNKPIIQNVLENETPDLTQKIKDTKSTANQIYVNNQYLVSQSAVLGASWNSKSGKDLLASVIELSNVLGEVGDSSSADTVFGQANWIRDSWNWEEGDSIYNQLVSSRKIIEDLKLGLSDYKKDATNYAQVKTLVKNFVALEKVIGTTSDSSPKKTLFAKIKNTEALALKLDDKSKEVDKVLGAFTKSKDTGITFSKTNDLKNQVIALNKVPGANSAISKINSDDAVSIKNVLLGLRGILSSNMKLLALGADKTLVNTWLEIGSIVFKTIATNPSDLVSQEVEIKYYLPAEIKKEDIIETDAGLTVEFDTEKNQSYVAGTFTLGAGQTRTFSVRTKDIWEYSESGIDSLRKQAQDLSAPLEKTAFFAQGVSLRSDINASLDQMTEIQAAAVTPEDKIRAYRQCKIIKESVDSKIAGMKDLVAQAGAAGNLFGFVGGSQAIAVWGLIIVIAAGFVFMSIYMKTITGRAKIENESNMNESNTNNRKDFDKEVVKKHVKHEDINPGKLIITMLISSVLSAGATGFVVNNVVRNSYEAKLSVLGASNVATPAPVINDATPVIQDEVEVGEDVLGTGTGGTYLVTILDTPTGFLRVRETPGGSEVGQVNPGDSLPFLDENTEWYQVSLESGESGWVSKEYSSKQ